MKYLGVEILTGELAQQALDEDRAAQMREADRIAFQNLRRLIEIYRKAALNG